MKTLIRTANLAISSFFLFNCSHASDLNNGVFVRERYMQIISDSKSPVKAAKSLRPQSIKVEKAKEGFTLKTIYDFNEGGPVFRFEKGKLPKLISGGATSPELKEIDSTHFVFGYKDHPKANFRYIADLENFVSRTCLGGNYVGSNKERVEFNDRGEFIVNGSKRRFTIGLYYPPSFDRDYFIVDSTEYGFLRKNDSLKIYEVMNGSLFEDGEMSPEPTMILVRKNE